MHMKMVENKKPQYPAATLAYYGPTDQLATKAVCGIIPRADADVEDLHKWITNAGDIRHDPAIGAEIQAFLKTHRVKTVLSLDKIFGCPHEEGIDYPEGADCPFCLFWAGRDRFADD
jgi:hypothetical protein